MATHSGILAGKTPGTGELGRLQSNGSQRVRHDWATKHSTSNMQKVNTILFPHWCYLKFTLGDDTCPITHVCQAVLERESPSQEGEGKPGSSDPALKEFILLFHSTVPFYCSILQFHSTDTSWKELLQRQRKRDKIKHWWRKGVFTMHLWVPGQGHFLANW